MIAYAITNVLHLAVTDLADVLARAVGTPRNISVSVTAISEVFYDLLKGNISHKRSKPQLTPVDKCDLIFIGGFNHD